MSFNYKCLSLLIGSVLSLPCAYGVSALPMIHRQTQKNVLTTSDEHTGSNTDITPFIQTIKLPMQMSWLTKPYEQALALYNLSLNNDFCIGTFSYACSLQGSSTYFQRSK